MTNRLAQTNSPYLLQHADNPVDWYPWSQEALEKARQEDKPIFLSIGYAACHWCHVMAHESFEDEEIAAIMNDHFINIKVDREERPDLDTIYMNAVVAMTGQGGWPMSVFLTPDGEPFFGGTYFPPTSRYNIPAFKDVLLNVDRAWRTERERITRSGEEISKHLRQSVQLSGSNGRLDRSTIETAAMSLAQAYDWKYGGWGQAPKFPQAMAIEFLLLRAVKNDKFAREMATHALNAMARGGIYDVIGGGFSRYSTDNNWLVPHFEKMLYDNALLARVYLHAHLISGEDSYREVCENTLDFIAREMSHPQGGFFSSLDADSEGVEGRYYLWMPDEVRAILGDAQEAELVISAYNLSSHGNFDGSNVLQIAIDDASLAKRCNLSVEQLLAKLDEIHKRLLLAREKRVKPDADDKVLTSWNSLAALVFSEAARYLSKGIYEEMAIRNIEFLLSELYTGERLLRSWRAGQAQHNAYLDDYAALILALISLYQTNHDQRWFNWALRLCEEMVAHYSDPAGGFYDTRNDHESLVFRPKDIQDNATPSGNALAATALLQLAAFTGRQDWRDMAETMLISIQKAASSYPTAFAQWLCAIDLALQPLKEVAILSPPSDARDSALIKALWSSYRPNLVAAISPYPPHPDAPALLDNRSLLDGQPTAYVCQNFVCNQPVNQPEDLLNQILD